MRLEMLHTACQWKAESLSFPGCSCWYIHTGLPISWKWGTLVTWCSVFLAIARGCCYSLHYQRQQKTLEAGWKGWWRGILDQSCEGICTELSHYCVHIMMQWSICLPIYNATLLTLWSQKHLKLKMKILKIRTSLPNACCCFLINISISYTPKCSHSHSRLCQKCYYTKLSAARTYRYLHVTSSYQWKQTNI